MVQIKTRFIGTTEAAKIIGCTTRHVGWLIRQGKIEAKLAKVPGSLKIWLIPSSEARRVRKLSGRKIKRDGPKGTGFKRRNYSEE